jgi:hypothetical protein
MDGWGKHRSHFLFHRFSFLRACVFTQPE